MNDEQAQQQQQAQQCQSCQILANRLTDREEYLLNMRELATYQRMVIDDLTKQNNSLKQAAAGGTLITNVRSPGEPKDVAANGGTDTEGESTAN